MGFLRPTQRRNQLNTFQTEMNQLMDDFFGGSLFLAPKETTNWVPRVNMSETETEYKLDIELPGLNEDEIHLDFHDNVLYFKGERKFENEEKDENWHRVETSYGSFQRAIPFERKVDEEKISAKLEKGVLKVRLAKADETQQGHRRISIQS